MRQVHAVERRCGLRRCGTQRHVAQFDGALRAQRAGACTPPTSAGRGVDQVDAALQRTPRRG
jgi:hypothetical protein